MNKCLTCGEEIESKPGKKKRLYCDSKCRLRRWQRNNKKQTRKKVLKTQNFASDPNDAILKQIEAIRAEKVPYNRDTILGRKSWTMEQQKRIQELQSKLV